MPRASAYIGAKSLAGKCLAISTIQTRKAGAQPKPSRICPHSKASGEVAVAERTAPRMVNGDMARMVLRIPKQSTKIPTKSCKQPKAI